MPKILYFVTEDFAFLSHRVPMAKKAKELGFDVCVATRINREADKKRIEDDGFRVIPINLNRSGINLIEEFKSLLEIIRIYKQEKPDIVHHVAMKPSLYGSFAAFLTKTPAVVNSIIGMGTVFTNTDIRSKIIKLIIIIAFRFLLNRKNSNLIIQNDDDFKFFADNKIVNKQRIVKIKGSGVDIDKFYPVAEPENKEIVVSLVSRMLWNKGIGETIGAAKILKNFEIPVKIRLVGDPDMLNPQTISSKELKDWQSEGLIEHLGHQEDIVKIWHESHIALLPSYREGLPKSLLEAGACGKPLITTDVPGCRELVQDGFNGLIVPAQSIDELANAIKKLAKNAMLREKLGKNARRIIEEEFSNDIIADKIGEIYSLLYKI